MEINWKNQILDNFISKMNHKWIVYDYDYLLADEELINAIRAMGFFIIEYDNPIRFRYEYEKFYRDKTNDLNENLELLVVIHNSEIDNLKIPYDVSFDARIISISLSDLFPQIDITILRLLTHKQYDMLQDGLNYEGLSRENTLSIRDSVIFVLKSVYGIYLIAIRDDVSFVQCLFRIHSHELHLDDIFITHIVEYFNYKQILGNWDIKNLLSSSNNFWNYIQELFEYRVFGKSFISNFGPVNLDIFSYELLIYLDNAFVDGRLRPMVVEESIYNEVPKSIQDVGVFINTQNIEKATQIRTKELFEKIKSFKLLKDSSYIDWFTFSNFYFSWCNLKEVNGNYSDEDKMFKKKINADFQLWLEKHFDSLCFENALHPIMGIRVIPYLQKIFAKGKKIAMIVIDGMSYCDWITIKNCLPSQKYNYYENQMFSWVPSITSVSRQVLFSGKLPKFFADKIHTTNYEYKEWRNAWIDNNSFLKKDDVYYAKSIDDLSVPNIINAMSNIYVAGLVINTVDDLMHGPQVLGMNSFHSNIKMWMSKGLLDELIESFLKEDFTVFLTSDHGHTEAIGVGQINEGVIAEDKGQRVRAYSTKNLRDNSGKKINNSVNWLSTTLPENYNALIAGYGTSFTSKDRKIITHGGISLEENIIPWIKVEFK